MQRARLRRRVGEANGIFHDAGEGRAGNTRGVTRKRGPAQAPGGMEDTGKQAKK